jgi:hypothetical protein
LFFFQISRNPNIARQEEEYETSRKGLSSRGQRCVIFALHTCQGDFFEIRKRQTKSQPLRSLTLTGGGQTQERAAQFRVDWIDRGRGRKCRTYDLLKSDSGFSGKIFKEVWNEIFAFCVGRTRPNQTSVAMAGRN